jgi:hypothetical protein
LPNASGGSSGAAGGASTWPLRVDGDEQMLVVIEIKGTDWDAIRRIV